MGVRVTTPGAHALGREAEIPADEKDTIAVFIQTSVSRGWVSADDVDALRPSPLQLWWRVTMSGLHKNAFCKRYLFPTDDGTIDVLPALQLIGLSMAGVLIHLCVACSVARRRDSQRDRGRKRGRHHPAQGAAARCVQALCGVMPLPLGLLLPSFVVSVGGLAHCGYHAEPVLPLFLLVLALGLSAYATLREGLTATTLWCVALSAARQPPVDDSERHRGPHRSSRLRAAATTHWLFNAAATGPASKLLSAMLCCWVYYNVFELPGTPHMDDPPPDGPQPHMKSADEADAWRWRQHGPQVLMAAFPVCLLLLFLCTLTAPLIRRLSWHVGQRSHVSRPPTSSVVERRTRGTGHDAGTTTTSRAASLPPARLPLSRALTVAVTVAAIAVGALSYSKPGEGVGRGLEGLLANVVCVLLVSLGTASLLRLWAYSWMARCTALFLETGFSLRLARGAPRRGPMRRHRGGGRGRGR